MEFNERLKKVRSITGLTQVEFAKLGGVKAVTQTNYERGLRFPTLEYLLNLKKAGVDIHFVIFGEVQDQGGLSEMESKLLLAYRNGGAERRKAIEFVAGIYNDDNTQDEPKEGTSNHHSDADQNKEKNRNSFFSAYSLDDMRRNAFNFVLKVIPIVSLAAILFWGVIHILTAEFITRFSEGSLLAYIGSLGGAIIALLFITLGCIKVGEKLLNYKDSNLVRLRQLRALFSR